MSGVIPLFKNVSSSRIPPWAPRRHCMCAEKRPDASYPPPSLSYSFPLYRLVVAFVLASSCQTTPSGCSPASNTINPNSSLYGSTISSFHILGLLNFYRQPLELFFLSHMSSCLGTFFGIHIKNSRERYQDFLFGFDAYVSVIFL